MTLIEYLEGSSSDKKELLYAAGKAGAGIPLAWYGINAAWNASFAYPNPGPLGSLLMMLTGVGLVAYIIDPSDIDPGEF